MEGAGKGIFGAGTVIYKGTGRILKYGALKYPLRAQRRLPVLTNRVFEVQGRVLSIKPVDLGAQGLGTRNTANIFENC